MTITFRDAIKKKVPHWLSRGYAEKLLYSLMVPWDALTEACAAAVKTRYPGLYTLETLPAIGRDRTIARGLYEPDVSYAGRLRLYLDSKRRSGSPFALLDQVRGTLVPQPVRVASVNRSGFRCEISSIGDRSFSQGTWQWDPVIPVPDWYRSWVLIYGSKWTDEGTWGDPGYWGDEGTIGSTATTEEVASLRSVVQDWVPPHAKCENVIVIFDEVSWDADLPDGGWDSPGNRNPNVIYLDGSL